MRSQHHSSNKATRPSNSTQLIKANKSNIDVSHKLQQALALHSGGALDLAAPLYQEILKLDPKHFDALQLLGTLATQKGEWENAIYYFEKSLTVNNKYPNVYFNQGIVYQKLSKLDAAIVSYNKAIALKPDYSEAYCNKGVVLKELKRFEEALTSLDTSIQLNPQNAQAYSNLGMVLKELHSLVPALINCNKAIILSPDSAEAHYNRACVLKEMNYLDAALTSFNDAIDLNPHYAQAHYGKGFICLELKRLKESLVCLDQAIRLKENYAEAYWTRAFTLLLTGDLKKGFQEYEWRFFNNESNSDKHKRVFDKPLWLGDESLEKKTIFIHCEQGLGDTVQFCRYTKLLAQRGAKVILEVQPPLFNLLQNLDGVHQLVSQGSALPEFDYQCPLASLPLALKTDSSTVPSGVRYIQADLKKVARWRARLGLQKRIRIGIVWSSTSPFKKDKERSITFKQMISAFPKGLFELICLQKEIKEQDEMEFQASEVRFFGEELTDFSETAALAQCMDLVISTCTSVPHLTAAIGIPTWILLQYVPDWRWQLDKEDSDWYPSAKLYRQKSLGDWESVLAQVYADLMKLKAL